MIKPALIVVSCKTRFAAMHHWPNAPVPFEYLAQPHRHEFHVEVSVAVSHENRDVEFIEMKRWVDLALLSLVTKSSVNNVLDLGSRSCEQIAIELGTMLEGRHQLNVKSVEVLEDGENGSTIYFN